MVRLENIINLKCVCVCGGGGGAPWQLTILTTQLVQKHKLQQTITFVWNLVTNIWVEMQPICYCAQIIEACSVTCMIMVIDAKISNNADQEICSNLFKEIKCNLSPQVTDRSQNTFI